MHRILRRRALALVFALLPVAVTLPGAEAQQANRPARVGFVWGNLDPASPMRADAVAALREAGWVEGPNIVLEHRGSEDGQFGPILAELLRLNVDVIVVGGGPSALQAAHVATKTIPIVMIVSTTDAVASGYIKSYARPGGNITGVAWSPVGVTEKRLQILKDAVPGVSHVCFIYQNLGNLRPDIRERTSKAARSLQMEPRYIGAPLPGDLETAMTSAKKEGCNGLLASSAPMFVVHAARVADLALKHHLPAVSGWRASAEHGLLMTYGPDIRAASRRAMTYVDRILRGAKPADLPVDQPEKYEFVINLKTARALGLTIAPTVLQQADHVIQ